MQPLQQRKKTKERSTFCGLATTLSPQQNPSFAINRICLAKINGRGTSGCPKPPLWRGCCAGVLEHCKYTYVDLLLSLNEIPAAQTLVPKPNSSTVLRRLNVISLESQRRLLPNYTSSFTVRRDCTAQQLQLKQEDVRRIPVQS